MNNSSYQDDAPNQRELFSNNFAPNLYGNHNGMVNHQAYSAQNYVNSAQPDYSHLQANQNTMPSMMANQFDNAHNLATAEGMQAQQLQMQQMQAQQIQMQQMQMQHAQHMQQSQAQQIQMQQMQMQQAQGFYQSSQPNLQEFSPVNPQQNQFNQVAPSLSNSASLNQSAFPGMWQQVNGENNMVNAPNMSAQLPQNQISQYLSEPALEADSRVAAMPTPVSDDMQLQLQLQNASNNFPREGFADEDQAHSNFLNHSFNNENSFINNAQYENHAVENMAEASEENAIAVDINEEELQDDVSENKPSKKSKGFGAAFSGMMRGIFSDRSQDSHKNEEVDTKEASDLENNDDSLDNINLSGANDSILLEESDAEPSLGDIPFDDNALGVAEPNDVYDPVLEKAEAAVAVVDAAEAALSLKSDSDLSEDDESTDSIGAASLADEKLKAELKSEIEAAKEAEALNVEVKDAHEVFEDGGDGVEDLILGEEGKRQEALFAERKIARDETILSSINEGAKTSTIKFSLLNQDELLEQEEKEETGIIEGEEEEYFTGNISVLEENLRTGTDSVAVSYGGARAPSDAEESSDEKKPVEEIVVTVLPEKEVYGTTLRDLARYEEDGVKLLPSVIHDIGVHWLAYGLAISACVLCLLKVYQVQETRDLTARLNEVVLSNAEMDKQWLNLVAQRQNLSEHAKIRTFASDNLKMVSPKTENERVISLHH